MTKIPVSYENSDETATSRLYRVLEATGCATWEDLADLLGISATERGDENSCTSWITPADFDASKDSEAILRNVLRCVPSSRLREELDKKK